MEEYKYAVWCQLRHESGGLTGEREARAYSGGLGGRLPIKKQSTWSWSGDLG